MRNNVREQEKEENDVYDQDGQGELALLAHASRWVLLSSLSPSCKITELAVAFRNVRPRHGPGPHARETRGRCASSGISLEGRSLRSCSACD